MNLDKIKHAKKEIDSFIETTPLIDASLICDHLWVKAENLQKTGSFKLRGATYKINQLSDEQKAKGVIAASAGNHAQGVALACKNKGIECTIIMPKHAPLSKVEATSSYDAKIELVGETFQEAYEYAKCQAKEKGLTFIEPYDDEDIIAGQGTVGLEILEKMPDVEVIYVPIGGGGLAAGISCAVKSLRPECKIIGVQAEGASSMKKSFDLKSLVPSDVKTMADGIAVKQVGEKTLDCCLCYIDEVITVTDEEIAATMLVLLEKMKLVAEGAGAASVAGAIYHPYSNKKSVAILSGGNVDVNYLAQIIDLGLMKTGRQFAMTCLLIDRPGNLKKLLDVVSELGANIVSIEHDRKSSEVLMHHCRVTLVLETMSKQHRDQLIHQLIESGYDMMMKHGEVIVTEEKDRVGK